MAAAQAPQPARPSPEPSFLLAERMFAGRDNAGQGRPRCLLGGGRAGGVAAASGGAGGRRGGRALPALLAGRSKKQKCGPKDKQKLQEAALRLLSGHQDLGDLLLEVGSSPCNKPSCASSSGTCTSEASVPELFVVSALQDQASLLGVPVGMLSARTAANNIEKISAASGQVVLLTAEQREKFSCFLQTLKDLLSHNAFSRLLFAQEMWKMQSPLILEVAWRLHRESIVSLDDLLESHPDAPALVEWLCSSLCLLCQQTEEPSSDTEPTGSILTDFVVVFLRNGFQKPPELGKKLELQKISETCCAVLERMLTWTLDTAAKEKQEDPSVVKAVKCWLHIFSTAAYQGTVPPESLLQFFRHTLTQVLTYNPQLQGQRCIALWKYDFLVTVNWIFHEMAQPFTSDAIRLQREWSFARTSPLLTLFYRKLFMVYKAEELILHLQQVLETSEVNWHHVLSCVSTLLICHSEAEELVKDLLGHLLRKAFENYDLENMITAFLIARQAALEGPAAFMPYSEWFKVAFGSASGFHGGSKKALVFFFKFLSELVPFEAPQYLKVHIMHPPFVPTKYRPFLLEYVTLARTRLADFKVAIEDMGLYEDLSSLKEAVQPHSQALQDAEKAIQIFEHTGKIPASVMEASIFRRSYYTSRFIPALLVPRVLPEVPDSRMALIECLKRAEKISPNAYSAYIEGCRAVKEKLWQGGSGKAEADDLKEPLQLLKAELEALRPLITDQDRHDAVPAQIAIVSEKLTGVLERVEGADEAAAPRLRIELNLSVPEVEQHDQGVVDLLLTSFCQNVMAASCFSPPERQGAWPSLWVKMLCGHQPLLPPLLSRLCQLMYHQCALLSEAHVIGLAVLVVHLNEAKDLIPAIDVCSVVLCSGSLRGLAVTELWAHLLACMTGESTVFCMRFCTAAVSYFLCKFPSLSHDELCALLHPGFVKKLQFVVPRLSLEARGISCHEDAAELSWEPFSQPALCYRKAALCLWKQARFRELVQEKAFQLTLQEWLLMELRVHPDTDVLSGSERREFHHWAVFQHFLPASAAAGGCDGDLRKACAVLIDTALDFCQRSELDNCSYLQDPQASIPHRRRTPDIHFRLQEMVMNVVTAHRRALPEGLLDDHEEHFLFKVFRQRLRALGTASTVGERLLWCQEVVLQSRMLLSLPPLTVIATRPRGNQIALDCEDYFGFVNAGLRNICTRGWALSYDITHQFFMGLLGATGKCSKPIQEVNSILTLSQDRCPIIICSAAWWWSRLEPEICFEWRRHFRGPFTQGLKSLKELQSSVNSFLSSEAAALVSDTPWISAAFLHSTAQQQMRYEKLGAALKRLGPAAGQLLVCLFFFSVVDFISARVTPEEGLDVPRTLDWSSKMLQCLEERRVSWLSIFSSAEKGQSPNPVLRSAVSDQHLRLFPVAFYSLLLAFDSERFIGEQALLYVAVDMYTQLLQLFMEGTTTVAELLGQREGSLRAGEPEDLLVLIRRARHFLLQAIPRCPQSSFANLQQLLGLCGELDPEIKAALVNSSAEGALLEQEDSLLF